MKFPTIIQSLFSSSSEQIERKFEPNSLARQNANLLKNTAMICHCGGIAPPTGETGYTYKCIRCSKTSRSIDYNLGNRTLTDGSMVAPKAPSQILNMEYYDEAIRLLRLE
ncbi:hypothetical protein [Psychrobacter sp. 16-MNA-CIBAN-0192]|uniref:hypothetical protein n=1 Tax=Psychrobacter sp. 16-MNA-CIBAN-0192 TaxID=3140448 RepID=UPI0033251911